MEVFSFEYWNGIATQYPLLGWGITLLIGVSWLITYIAKNIPAIQTIKSKIFMPLAEKFKNSWLAKQAMDAEIKGKVNTAVLALKNELPSGWVKPLEIVWMKHEDKKSFIDDGRLVLRMQPLKDQDKNFSLAVYDFFQESIFPETKSVVPETTRESIALYLSRRLITTQSPSMVSCFEDYVLEPAVEKREKILDQFEQYEPVDNRGLFTGTYLRELNDVAKAARFNKYRQQMTNESSQILNHMQDFLKSKPRPDNIWVRKGPLTSYGLLLVAMPYKTKAGTKQYINRAKGHLDKGVDRLYVYGTEMEKKFANKVIDAIDKEVEGLELVEKFKCHKDYRGQSGGVGAFFVKKMR